MPQDGVLGVEVERTVVVRVSVERVVIKHNRPRVETSLHFLVIHVALAVFETLLGCRLWIRERLQARQSLVDVFQGGLGCIAEFTAVGLHRHAVDDHKVYVRKLLGLVQVDVAGLEAAIEALELVLGDVEVEADVVVADDDEELRVLVGSE